MTKTGGKNSSASKLEKEIGSYLGMADKHLNFKYQLKDKKIKLDLITINPKHDQSFLLNSVIGVDKQDALVKLRNYIINRYENENSFTVQWMKTGENQLHTSYFRANNMYEVLDKFFYGRDQTSHKIFNVVLNPIS